MLTVYDVMPREFQNALADEYVTDLAVRDNGNGYITRYGGHENIGSQAHTVPITLCLAADGAGLVINDEHPTLECKLPNGERLTGKTPKAGPAWTITIRIPKHRRLTWDEQIGFKTVTKDIAEWIDFQVGVGQTIAILGEMGSGKTHMLSTILGSSHLSKRVTVKLEAVEEIIGPEMCTTYLISPLCPFSTAREKALRESAKVFIMGEARGPGEMNEVITTVGAGQQSFTTFHAKSVEDAPHRITKLLMDYGCRLSREEIHEDIVRNIDVFIYMREMEDGRRIIADVAKLEMKGGIAIRKHIDFGFDTHFPITD